MELVDEHQGHIQLILTEGDDLLTAPQTGTAVASVRWRLARRLRAYQLFKHVELLDPMIERGAPARADPARAMKERCLAMGNAYHAHLDQWPLRLVEESWPAFQAAERSIATRIRSHLARERSDASLLLRGVERIRRA